MSDARGAQLQLDRSQIPHDLLELVPIVEKWGFASQEDQDAYVSQMRAHSHELKEFNSQVDRFRDRIIEWGRSIDRDISRCESHPYWSFLDVLKVRELTEEEDSPKMVAARHRVSKEVRIYKFEEAASKAEVLFREKRYVEFVAILSAFEDLLTETQRAKFALAKKRM